MRTLKIQLIDDKTDQLVERSIIEEEYNGYYWSDWNTKLYAVYQSLSVDLDEFERRMNNEID